MDVSESFSTEDHEMKKPRSSEPQDRLSELPDPLILIILSFLPTRQAIRTTVLSKRWKDLWTTVPCLDFSDDINDSGKLPDFVNRALSFWKGNKILKFKIDLLFDMSLASSLDSWVRFAMEKEVEEIYLGFMYDEDVIMSTGDAGFGAPQCLYSCSSIRKLSLLGCDLKINGDLQWNQLKSLRIDGFRLCGDVINHILSCTQLEVLKLLLKESYVDLNIQSCSLKRLTITKYLYIDDDPATDTVLRIWAPNLEILVISGVLYSKCRLMNVSSLTDATLDLYVPKNYNDGKELLGQMLRQIFQTIHHVEKVTLSDSCIKVIGVLEKKYLLSSSSGVKFLKLNASSIELDKIVDLLKIFPKLKMLAIEHTDLRLKEVKYQTFRENLRFQERRIREPLKLDAEPTSFLLQLRRVEITWFLCETSIFPLIELLLKYASTLEKMVIRARRMMSLAPECFFLASQKLLRMPRSSPTAEVILCENDIILFHVKSHCQLEKGSSVP